MSRDCCDRCRNDEPCAVDGDGRPGCAPCPTQTCAGGVLAGAATGAALGALLGGAVGGLIGAVAGALVGATDHCASGG